MPSIAPTNGSRKRNEQALESFHRYYASQWGEVRWHSSLHPALVKSTRYCALINKYADEAEARRHVEQGLECPLARLDLSQDDGEGVSLLALVRPVDDNSSFCGPRSIVAEDSRNLQSHWNMDGGSVLAARLLSVEAGDNVLDLCAAPGGKSIALAQGLWPSLYRDDAAADIPNQNGCLHANEVDRTRYKNLASNLEQYLPGKGQGCEIKVTNLDATGSRAVYDLPLGINGYDKVLVDAPCSSERHIIHAHLKASQGGRLAEEMMNWKSSHTKTLAKTQIALLSTALQAVKTGGRVVYATCSISSEENDGVIERYMESCKRNRKRGLIDWKVEVDDAYEKRDESRKILDAMTEKTKFGRIALPDHPAGGMWGPLYFCILKKVVRKQKQESGSIISHEPDTAG